VEIFASARSRTRARDAAFLTTTATGSTRILERSDDNGGALGGQRGRPGLARRPVD